VSGELWWESHTQLFYALDKCGSVGGSGGGGRDGSALRRDRVEEDDDGFSHTQAEQLSRTDSRLVLLFPHFLSSSSASSSLQISSPAQFPFQSLFLFLPQTFSNEAKALHSSLQKARTSRETTV
jgi:hypothetical protein